MTLSERPILTTKRFRVSVDVEINIHELPQTIQDTWGKRETQYGKGLEPQLQMEQQLIEALLHSPDVLRRFLEDRAVYEVECAENSQLVEEAFGEETDPTRFLIEVLDQIPEESQELFVDFYSCDAIYHAINAEVVAVSVEELALPQSTENGEGEDV